jgi:uncharacterized protein (TIGR02266 family)
MDNEDTKSFNEDRRERVRYAVRINVNYRHGDTYLFSRTSNVSELGIFLVSENPLSKDTTISLEFDIPNSRKSIQVLGRVTWVETRKGTSEPGMGIQFIGLTADTQKQIRSLIRTLAFIDD